MNSSRKIFRYFIIFLCVLLILASLLSLIYDLPYWYSKVLDFPREQYLIAGLVLLIIFILLNKNWNRASYFLVLGLLGSTAIQSTRVLPYLIGKKTVPDAPLHFAEENSFSIMISNVLIKNRDSEDFLKVVRKHNPDIVMAMEVNKWWIQQLVPLKKKYSYVVEIPNEAAYGLAVYSRFPLKNKEIKYLKHQNVPSLHCEVTLPGGKKFKFHAVHPVAPFPSDKYPDNEGEEEVALSKVGKMVLKDSLPVLVAGDFNDVSWSHTTRLFGESAKLHNVRLGRGLFNTFNAKSWIMRWPLDHFFVSRKFRVVKLERLSRIGSDHFPMYAEFYLQ